MNATDKSGSQQAVGKAARDIVTQLIKAYRTERGIHAETIVAAAAALSGEWALRASGVPLPDSGWIVGGTIGELSVSGDSSAWKIICEGAVRAGARTADLLAPDAVIARTVGAFGQSVYPPLSVTRQHWPSQWPPHAAARFREYVVDIGRQYQLEPRELMTACATATAFLIHEGRDALAPDVSCRLALETMIGVSRMAPLSPERGPGEGTALPQ